jgi:hypothetical protein
LIRIPVHPKAGLKAADLMQLLIPISYYLVELREEELSGGVDYLPHLRVDLLPHRLFLRSILGNKFRSKAVNETIDR